MALSATTARVMWSPVAGANLGYQVFMKVGLSSVQVGTAPAGASTVIATGLTSGTTDQIFVRAISSTLTPFSRDSVLVSIVMPQAVGTPVASITVLSQTTGASWTPVTGVSGYRIYEKVNNQIFLVGYAGPSTTSFTLVGLRHGQTESFMVEAFIGFIFSDSQWQDVTT